MLSQDTVADANRLLAYHRYVQRERARQIQALTQDLDSLAQVEQQIEQRRLALDQARQQQQQQSKALSDERRKRAATVADLDGRYQETCRAREGAGRGHQGAGTTAQEPARSRRSRRRRNARPRRAKRAAAASAQAKAGNRGSKTPPKVVASAPAPKVGGLGWPVSGNLLARYGGRLPDGRTSSGVLIGAPNGTTVTAVADGTGGVLRLDDRLRDDPDHRPWERLHEPVRA